MPTFLTSFIFLTLLGGCAKQIPPQDNVSTSNAVSEKDNRISTSDNDTSQTDNESDKTLTALQLGSTKVNKKINMAAGFTLEGKQWRLGTHFENNSSKAVIITYFADWCAPCKKGLPIIQALSKSNNADLVMIALKSNNDDIKKLLVELNIDYGTVVIDKFGSIATRHGVIIQGESPTIPKTFVTNGSGIVHSIILEEGKDFRQALQHSITTASSN